MRRTWRRREAEAWRACAIKRLMALLHDLVDDEGRVEAAELLEVSYRILVRAVESGRLTRRLSDALERLLLAKEVEGSVALRERVRTLEGRMEAVEDALRGCREELLAAIEAGDKRLWGGSRAEEEGGRGPVGGAGVAPGRGGSGIVRRRREQAAGEESGLRPAAAPRAGDPGAGTRRGTGVRRGDAADRRVAACVWRFH